MRPKDPVGHSSAVHREVCPVGGVDIAVEHGEQIGRRSDMAGQREVAVLRAVPRSVCRSVPISVCQPVFLPTLGNWLDWGCLNHRHYLAADLHSIGSAGAYSLRRKRLTHHRFHKKLGNLQLGDALTYQTAVVGFEPRSRGN